MAAFKISHAILTCFIVTAVVSLQPIVSVDKIEANGGTFSVTCDASTVDLPSSVNNVSSLSIKRRTSLDTSNVLLAEYSVYGSTPQVQNIPFGRQWTVDFTGANGGVNNRNTMKVVILVSDAICADAGAYTCSVGYTGGYYNQAIVVSLPVSRTENVVAKAAVEGITLNANRYKAVPDRPNYSEYERDDNITLTCRVNGPQELKIQWKQGRDEYLFGFTITDYPYDNDITTTDPSPINTGSACNQYAHTSVLNLRSLSKDNDQVVYMCVVKQNRYIGAPEVARANLTIGVTSNEGTISFTITVEADSVTIPDYGVTDIVELTLNRRTSHDLDFQLVAQYKAYGNSPEVKNIPLGRNWVVTFSGANGGTNNRNTMRMKVFIRDAQSSDAGLYQFIVRYVRLRDGAAVDVSVTRSLTPNGEPGDGNSGAIISGSIGGCILVIIAVVAVI